MSELSADKAGRKKDWALTPGAFHRLLEWLDEGASSEGLKYLEMRRRLVAYFDRKLCPAPDELADETLNRVARRLEEEEITETETPAKYCYITARFVFMEHLRSSRKGSVALEEVRHQPRGHDPAAAEAEDERQSGERMLDCLEQFASQLDPPSRDLITRYYVGEQRARIENRRALAEELRISVNALSIRACRIRDRLEECVKRCASRR